MSELFKLREKIDKLEKNLADALARVERAEGLAYIGESRFPDSTYKSRLEECVIDLRRTEAERDEARREWCKARAGVDTREALELVERYWDKAVAERLFPGSDKP